MYAPLYLFRLVGATDGIMYVSTCAVLSIDSYRCQKHANLERERERESARERARERNVDGWKHR